MLQSNIPTPDSRQKARARWWLPLCLGLSLLNAVPIWAATNWTEYNLGPFYVDTDGEQATARAVLTQLEQTRWVLEGLLENKDLTATWPIRVLVTKSFPSTSHFFLSNGYYLLVCNRAQNLPLGELAQLFLDANTPRLPPEVEEGLHQLFDTLKANGSHVTWGDAPAHPDLAFARMHLFATQFEYSASFHVFINSLRNGSSLPVAEHNAFGKDSTVLEREAGERLSRGVWPPISTSGRPLDPRRDFGEHDLDGTSARVYGASARIPEDATWTEAALKLILNEGGVSTALVFESFAAIAAQNKEKAGPFLEDAMRAGSKDAAIYVQAAEGLPPDQSLPLLRKAADLNPRWAQPLIRQAEDTEDLSEREALLKKGLQLNQRAADTWVELARTQMKNGHALAAQSSWVRAEHAAEDVAKQRFIEHLHESLESARLDDAEAERKRERENERLEDERARQAETNRIKAAEQRASQTNANGGGSTDDAVDWSSLVKPQKMYGTVVMVDCRSGYARVAVRDLRGTVRQLLLDKDGQKLLPCNAKPDKRQVVVTFRPQQDDVHGTDGDIIEVAWR